MTTHRWSRRTFLKSAAAGAAVAGFPATLRAQPKTIKLGVVHCVTGPLAEPGQACRLAAQIAVDQINGAGGIKSMGDAKFEILLGDTQTKADVARAEAERLVNAGAHVLVGTFNSSDTAAIVPVAIGWITRRSSVTLAKRPFGSRSRQWRKSRVSRGGVICGRRSHGMS